MFDNFYYDLEVVENIDKAERVFKDMIYIDYMNVVWTGCLTRPIRQPDLGLS